MYYDAQRKLAFVFPPRTGSTTFVSILKKLGLPAVSSNDKHILPKDAFVQMPELQEYALYGFFRDPVDRFLSTNRYILQNSPEILKLIHPMAFEFLQQEKYPELAAEMPIYFYKQVDHLENANLLDFKNYTSEILRVAKMLGVKQINFARTNATLKDDGVPSQKLIDFVQSHYADDYRLGRERGLLV